MGMRRESGGGLKLAELPEKMSRLKHVGENLTLEEKTAVLQDSYENLESEVDFELFLRVNRCCFTAFRFDRAIQLEFLMQNIFLKR